MLTRLDQDKDLIEIGTDLRQRLLIGAIAFAALVLFVLIITLVPYPEAPAAQPAPVSTSAQAPAPAQAPEPRREPATRPALPAAPAAPQRPAAPQQSAAPGSATRTYRVAAGDTLASVALRHDVDYRRIAADNRLTDPNLIRPGQLLRIGQPAPDVHLIQPGDTLSGLAGQAGLTVRQLRALNPWISNPDRIPAGAGLRMRA
uniref:LysM peptidoglycan-binding domain-containing protein n=1 Tax=Pseudonocardia sp. CA-138482 TaxID=3240023 RepID=UPI003F493591